MQPLIEVAFLLIYAALLAAVTPYVTGEKDNYGSLIPGAAAIATGSVIWSVLTWLGLPDTEGWIWTLTMILMPVGMGFAIKYYGKVRSEGKFEFVDKIGQAIASGAGSSKADTDGGEDVLVITSTAAN